MFIEGSYYDLCVLISSLGMNQLKLQSHGLGDFAPSIPLSTFFLGLLVFSLCPTLALYLPPFPSTISSTKVSSSSTRHGGGLLRVPTADILAGRGMQTQLLVFKQLVWKGPKENAGLEQALRQWGSWPG